MIDNFNQIMNLLSFNSEDEFYFVQIIQRKKDNKNAEGSNNSNRLIKAYYIASKEQLTDLKHEMIFFAKHFNARVGINFNKRSFMKTAFNTLKQISDQMMNKDFKAVRRAYNRSCGIHNAVEDKVWILDIDTDEIHIRNNIIKSLDDIEPISINKLIAIIPSKSGCHLITKPFNTEKFRMQHPETEIHKNNPTNLYIP